MVPFPTNHSFCFHKPLMNIRNRTFSMVLQNNGVEPHPINPSNYTINWEGKDLTGSGFTSGHHSLLPVESPCNITKYMTYPSLVMLRV